MKETVTTSSETSACTGSEAKALEIKVLLVEDNAVEALLMKSALAKAANQSQRIGVLDVVWVTTLSACLEHLLKADLDAVLLDLSLPDSDGKETLRQVLQHSAAVPIVVLTGRDDESLALEAVQIGAQDYLIKGRSDGNDVVRAIRYALERHRLQKSLFLIDGMTGLYNGRGFVTLAEQHLRKVWRTKGVSLLLYADMDGLKKINDVYGHHEGSKAIVDIAEVLKKTFRESDIIARVGGDEFVIIATDADNRLVQEMLERLEQNLQKVNALGLTPYHLSLSVGVVTVNGSEQRSLEDLLKDADAAMYSNKYSKRQEIR